MPRHLLCPCEARITGHANERNLACSSQHVLVERILVDIVLAAHGTDELGCVNSSAVRSQCRWRGLPRAADVTDDVAG